MLPDLQMHAFLNTPYCSSWSNYFQRSTVTEQGEEEEMSAAKMRQQLLVAIAVSGILMLSAAGLAMGDSAVRRGPTVDDREKLLGDWTGESICIGNHPACHDERVVFHISKSPDAMDRVVIAADKIIDGKPDPMYVLDFKYDSEKGTLTGEFSNSRYHGIWEYTIKGDAMEGTLSLLPAKTIFRRVKIKKAV